jgi:DNA recombination protein RmuC
METVIVLGALILGVVIGFLLALVLLKGKGRNAQSFTMEELQQSRIKLERLSVENEQKGRELQDLRQKALVDQKSILELSQSLSVAEANLQNLKERFESQAADYDQLHKKLLVQFENISHKVLQENAMSFHSTSSKNLEGILHPLKEKLEKFEAKVQQTYEKQLVEHTSLKEQISMLAELNKKIEADAENLTKALKGDKKLQGNWGEMLLERILEKSGLEKDIHFKTQDTYVDDEGLSRRPDVVIYLPDDKHLIVDSKVSLNAYHDYYNAEDDLVKKVKLQEHLSAIRNHIRQLSEKNYHQLRNVNSPDFVLMFIPLEPAFTLAMQQDDELFFKALDNQVVLVTSSTLLATLRTVAGIWKQENQKRNVLEIARESGKLYDKFVGFVGDMKQIGEALQKSQKAYDAALNKLSTGQGNLVSKVEKLKSYGVKHNKQLDNDMLQKSLE